MTKIEIPNLLAHFADVPDPRDPRGIRHDLSDIIHLHRHLGRDPGGQHLQSNPSVRSGPPGDEDDSRARIQNAQATWVVLRHLAVNLLKRDKSLKVG